MNDRPVNMVTKDVGAIIVSRQNRETPSDAEWDDFLKYVEQYRVQPERVRILVSTDGGGPTAAQRKRLQDALSGTLFRVAVVSDSVKVRFIVSSVALLNREISTFSRSETDDAFAYLGLTFLERKLITRELAAMDEAVR